ncbi:MAG: beta-L-arabinofuranosidase domain-containing protein, partial [Vicinamibacteria bacterium]
MKRALLIFLLGVGCREREPPAPDYPITPVPFTEVTVGEGFWARRIETNRTVTLPFALEQNEITGRLDNFLKAAGRKEGPYEGERYNDTDVYKVLEGAAYALALRPDPELDSYLDEVIDAIAAAQEDDGYLFTPRTVDSGNPPLGIGDERWSNLPVSHELYNAGHLYEAAVAHYQSTGKRSLLDVAVKNANLISDTFGPDRIHGAPGHQEIELALVKLYRVTGEEKFLSLARYFLEQRGRVK